jgi:hypothetical protein
MKPSNAPSPAAQIQASPPLAVSRPRLFDYGLIWVGVGVSAVLAELSGLRARSPTPPGPGLEACLRAVPFLLLLPVGVILCWPLFYLSQWVLGRRHGLSAGEWLLGLAWLGALGFSFWIVGRGASSLPEPLTSDAAKQTVVFGYILTMLSLGALAVVVALIGMIGRWPQPWTHTLSITLLVWPAAPLLVVWLMGIRFE